MIPCRKTETYQNMKLKQLFEDDGAVSPVIGVILMVAITVILAAVIGTFVLGLGDRVSQAQPTATFTFEYTDGSPDEVSITHDGGDAVEISQLSVNVAGTVVWEAANTPTDWSSNGWGSGEITAGDELTLTEGSNPDMGDGDKVKIIWTADGSDKTAVIGQSEVSL